MCRVNIEPGAAMSKRQADFLSCLLEGLFASLPYFLEAFMKCMSAGDGKQPTDDYTPGSRERCK